MLDMSPFKRRPLLSTRSCKHGKLRQQPNNDFKTRRGATFWQFHHALLHGGFSRIDIFGLWSKPPKQDCDILNGVFQMISVTESKAVKHCFKENTVCVCARACVGARAWWQRAANADICNANGVQVKNTLYKLQRLFIDDVIAFPHLLNPPYQVSR